MRSSTLVQPVSSATETATPPNGASLPLGDDVGGFHSAFRLRPSNLEDQLPALVQHAQTGAADAEVRMLEISERRAALIEAANRRRAAGRHLEAQIEAARRRIERCRQDLLAPISVLDALAAAWPLLPATGGAMAIASQLAEDVRGRRAWLVGGGLFASSVAVLLGQQEVRRRRQQALEAAEARLEQLDQQQYAAAGVSFEPLPWSSR